MCEWAYERMDWLASWRFSTNIIILEGHCPRPVRSGAQSRVASKFLAERNWRVFCLQVQSAVSVSMDQWARVQDFLAQGCLYPHSQTWLYLCFIHNPPTLLNMLHSNSPVYLTERLLLHGVYQSTISTDESLIYALQVLADHFSTGTSFSNNLALLDLIYSFVHTPHETTFHPKLVPRSFCHHYSFILKLNRLP